MGSVQKADKEAWFKSTLQPGSYYICMYTPWTSFVDLVTLASYGPEEITFTALEKHEEPANFYQKVVADKAANDDACKWTPIAKEKYPNIRYKFSHSANGFGYLHFENEEADVAVTTEITFKKCKNLRALAPYSFDKPTMIIPPGSKETFIYFMIDTPSSISFSLVSSFKKNIESKRKEVKEQGKKFERLYKKKSCGINVYGYRYEEGASWEWENLTSDLVLEENVQFNISNSYIEGMHGDRVKVVLQPGQTKIVNVIFGDSGNSKGAGNIADCSYVIKPKS
jgi:hypothetical protein